MCVPSPWSGGAVGSSSVISRKRGELGGQRVESWGGRMGGLPGMTLAGVSRMKKGMNQKLPVVSHEEWSRLGGYEKDLGSRIFQPRL